MKIDPGFLTHWKTERLVEQLGSEGVVALLRLWGRAQINREWKGFHFTPRRLALETKWKGDENHLFNVLTDPDAPWLDAEDGGTFSIHGFEEHQKQVIHLWSAGGKGGRPKKEKSPTPSKEKEDTYSSSYPICSANDNHMVSDQEVKPLCTLKQAIDQAPVARMTADEAAHWWNVRNSSGWTKGTQGGGAPRKITSWQSDMSTSAGWVKESLAKSRNTKPTKEFNSQDVGI